MSELPHPHGSPTRAALESVFGRSFFSSGQSTRSLEDAVSVPEDVYAALPGLLRVAVGTAPRSEVRPILLASVFAVLSACLPNVRGLYAGRWYDPPVLTGLIAPPGSNKGLASYAVRLVKGLDGVLTEASARDIETMRTKGEFVEGLRPHGLVLPADASSAGLIDVVAQSGWPVVLFETEIDSAVGSASQDWRQLSPLLRKASEHEPLSVIRKGYAVRVERPRVAALLSGTPDQFVRLIPSASDGLFSRFWWVWTPPTDEWHSPRPQPGRAAPETVLEEAGREISRLHAALLHRDAPVDFHLRDGHWDVVDAVGRGLKARARKAGYGSAVDSLVHRTLVVAFRLAMVADLFGRADEVAGDGPSAVTATDDAFEVGLTLALVGLDHGLRLHGLLPADPGGPALRNEDLIGFFESLPDRFDRATALEYGKSAGFAERTVDKYLRTFRDHGLATRPRKGLYVKSGSPPMPHRSDNGDYLYGGKIF